MRFSDFYKQIVISENQKIARPATLAEGIVHFEALPINKFLYAVENMAKFIATEKLDGFQLRFGFTNQGNFFTSREAKGGKDKFTQASQYPLKPANNGFRSAHKALSSVQQSLRSIINNGETVECEILFGAQPNAIIYGDNYIAFLRMVVGENGKAPVQHKIQQLHKLLQNKIVSTTSDIVTTDDGISLHIEKKSFDWKFTSTSFIDSHRFAEVDVSKEIKNLKIFLKKTNNQCDATLTNYEIITANLNTIPKQIRPCIKMQRESLLQYIQDQYKLPIKEKFLNVVVRKLKPVLRTIDVASKNDTGIEGIVLLDPRTLEQFKLVDRDIFTAINNFNFGIRSEIRASSVLRDTPATLGREIDLFNEMLAKIGTLLGIKGLSPYFRIKQTLKRYKGNTIKQTVENLASVAIQQASVEKMKQSINTIIVSTLNQRDAYLKKYNAEWQNYTLQLKNGRQIKYSDEIHHRTLIVFAELRENLIALTAEIAGANVMGDIILALYSTQIRQI